VCVCVNVSCTNFSKIHGVFPFWPVTCCTLSPCCRKRRKRVRCRLWSAEGANIERRRHSSSHGRATVGVHTPVLHTHARTRAHARAHRPRHKCRWCCENVGGLSERMSCHMFCFLDLFLFYFILGTALSLHLQTNFDDLFVIWHVSVQRCAF